MKSMIHDNLLDDEVINNPHPYFKMLRENDPVHWNEKWEGWILTKYEDVSNAFLDERYSAQRMQPREKMEVDKKVEMESTFRILSKWMVFNDPPSHTRLRMLVNKAFTPKAVQQMKPRIEEISDQLLDNVQGKVEIDLIKDYAYALPILVISDLLGVPREDRDLIKKWSDNLLYFLFGAVGVEDRHEMARKSLEEMSEYLWKLIEQRRENQKDDLISSIVMASNGEDKLTNEEIIATCTLLVFGGHETTTNLIANGTMCLLENPNELEKLKKNPSLIGSAIEEFLRFEGPSKAMVRMAKENFELRGKNIQKGDRILLVQASANRDPEIFENPDKLDIERNPNQHLGFGKGIHYCLGASLARMEGAIGIGKLISRFPNIKLKSGKLEWVPTIINRQLKQLPVSLQ